MEVLRSGRLKERIQVRVPGLKASAQERLAEKLGHRPRDAAVCAHFIGEPVPRQDTVHVSPEIASPSRDIEFQVVMMEVAVIVAPLCTCDLPVAEHQRSEEHTSELQSLTNLVCRLLLE